MRSFLPPNPTAAHVRMARSCCRLLGLVAAGRDEPTLAYGAFIRGRKQDLASLLEYAEVLADVYEEKAPPLNWKRGLGLWEMVLDHTADLCSVRTPPLVAFWKDSEATLLWEEGDVYVLIRSHRGDVFVFVSSAVPLHVRWSPFFYRMASYTMSKSTPCAIVYAPLCVRSKGIAQGGYTIEGRLRPLAAEASTVAVTEEVRGRSRELAVKTSKVFVSLMSSLGLKNARLRFSKHYGKPDMPHVMANFSDADNLYDIDWAPRFELYTPDHVLIKRGAYA